MDFELAKEAMDIALSKQKRYDFAPPSKEKMEAKTEARDAVYRWMEVHGKKPESSAVLDVGHEAYYADLFHSVTPANLPDDDMHDLRFEKFDAVIAMHVLEHSPFPLMALLSLKRCLAENGILYIAVPFVDVPFLTDPCHFTVLHKDQWKKLFSDVGFRILEESEGRFNTYKTAREWRFVLGV